MINDQGNCRNNRGDYEISFMPTGAEWGYYNPTKEEVDAAMTAVQKSYEYMLKESPPDRITIIFWTLLVVGACILWFCFPQFIFGF